MKKSLLVAIMLFAGMFTYCYGQDVNVNINNQGNSTNANGEFRINGISSSEDIGGVDVEFIEQINNDGTRSGLNVVFTNYNSFSVTTLCQAEYLMPLTSGSCKEEKTFNVVLKANSSKTINVPMAWDGSVKGMIVRKLAQ